MDTSRLRRTWICSIAMAAAAASVTIAAPAQAQAPGGRPIRIIAPTAVGGGIDLYSRLLAQELTPLLGESVIVENRAGGSTIIGTDHVAKSAPDGRTMLLTTNGYTIIAAVMKSLPYDPLKDLIPVTTLGSQPFVLFTHSSVNARDWAELLTLSRTPGSNLSYTSCGAGTPQHMAAELLKSMTGADLTHIPYRGCGPAAADVVAGQVPVGLVTISTVIPHVPSGKIRPLAVTTRKRARQLPNVPTLEEAGLAGYHVDQWFGLFVPGKTPREVIDRLNANIAKTVNRADFVKKLDSMGIEAGHGTPEEFGRVLRSDIERWSKLAKSINLKLD